MFNNISILLQLISEKISFCYTKIEHDTHTLLKRNESNKYQ